MLLTRAMRRTILLKERYGDSLSGGESDTQPSNREADTTTELSLAIAAKSGKVSSDVMISSWGVTEETKIREKTLV